MKLSDYKQRISRLIATLGVVYGDIGTSPLYAVKECFLGTNMSISKINILSTMSLIFWTLTMVVTIKYIFIVMRANSNGEGGVLALLSLIKSKRIANIQYRYFALLAFAGMALFFGGTSITPAISILSALEGLLVVTNSLNAFIVPLAILIVAILFYIQSYGTEKIGNFFGPIMLFWFLSIGFFGFLSVLSRPDVLYAINPIYAIKMVSTSFKHTLLMVSFLVLCVTGAESIYADMGHFEIKNIKISWFFIVFPCLILNYFGQGAALLNNPYAVSNPFYYILPGFIKPFMILLATLASTIASQAVISGIFSLCKQAVQIEYLPKIRIIHTSEKQAGQIYIPAINWILFVIVCITILLFRTSNKLAEAYGLASSGVMIITSFLAFFVTMKIFNWNKYFVYTLFSLFFIMDATFLYSNLLNFFHGGWFPLLLSLIMFGVMYIWDKQYKFMHDKIHKSSIGFNKFFEDYDIDDIQRVDGTGIFLSQDENLIPLSLIKHIKHNKCLPNKVVILSIVNRMVPRVSKHERIKIHDMPDKNIIHVISTFGFMQMPKVPRILQEVKADGLSIDLYDCTYYVLNALPSFPERMKKMNFIGAVIFRFLLKNTTSVWHFFGIPYQKVLEMGILVKVLE